MDMKALSQFDWRSLSKYFSPKAADDANAFLEKLPQNSSKKLLIITGIIWSLAAALGLFTTVKMQALGELTLKRDEASALLPVVPELQDKPVSAREILTFVEGIQDIYKGLEIKANGSSISIRAKATSMFGQFREAIGHVQNGGEGWRVSVEKLCVGKECQQYPLAALLKINKVSVEKVF